MKKFFLGILFAFIPFSWALANPAEGEKPPRYKIELSEHIGEKKVVTGETGIELLVDYLTHFFKYAVSIIGIISVIVIVGAGGVMMVSAGNQGVVDAAKEKIYQALLSLILLLLSGFLLDTINPGFFGAGGGAQASASTNAIFEEKYS